MQKGSAVSTAPDALRLAGTLIILVRALEQQVRAASGADVLTLTDIGVLGQIDRGVELPSQVARALRLDPARVTHVTDRLVQHGYVARTVDPHDRRCWRLQLTDTGRQRLAEGRREVASNMERLLEGLSDVEREQLIDALERVRRHLADVPAASPSES
jgi:DNA-binding MarR family transcriptional regulator